MQINIKQIPNGKWKENCYVVSSLNGDALILDPGGAKTSIVNFIRDKNLNVRAILNTHAHYDHIGAIKQLKDEFSIPLFFEARHLRTSQERAQPRSCSPQLKAIKNQSLSA